MEYETVTVYDHDRNYTTYRLIDQEHYPVDIDRQRRVRSKHVVITRRSGFGRRRQPVVSKSPSQDTLSRRSTSSRRVPKTLGDTNEFISAFWINGKPKCRKGYTYDFKRKMCRRL